MPLSTAHSRTFAGSGSTRRSPQGGRLALKQGRELRLEVLRTANPKKLGGQFDLARSRIG
ncbi:MAG: hypothetical protein O3C40_08700 [Planctomycetota bacterium]|nr:hypothetical protein [Planctomycetota bacterium]